MLLQVQYGWHHAATGLGFAVMAAVGCVVSLSASFMLTQEREPRVLAVSTCLSIVGACLLFDSPRASSRASCVLLLVGAAITWGCAAVQGGVSNSWGLHACMPGRGYSSEWMRSLSMWARLAARAVGPVLGRFLVGRFGHNAYGAFNIDQHVR